jgi:tetratricopeptide (TPR) repeat protein
MLAFLAAEADFVTTTTARVVRGMRLAALAIVIAAGAAVPAAAQETDNEYYASRGTPLLRTVEHYHLYPAEEKFRARTYEQAFNDLTFILRYFPNHPRALLLMVQLCTEWKSSHCTLDMVFEKAIAIKPDAPGTFVANGIYLHRAKRYKDAIASYERALALEPDSMNAHYNLALTYLETRQFAEANQHAQRAYALGATLPGLRQRLQQAQQWNPAAAEPASGPRAATSGASAGLDTAPAAPPR